MNRYKKTLLLISATLIATQAYGMSVNYNAQLDAEGKAVLLELKSMYTQFIKTIGSPNLQFDFAEWNFLFNTNVKQYVTNHSKVLGVPDSDLIHNLNLLLHGNSNLMVTMKKVETYKRPARKLNEVDYHLLSEQMLKPFEKIEQNVKNILIPRIENLTFYVSDKKKAQAMLIGAFNLLRLMAAAMVNYTAAIIYMD